jgi:sulfite exporter TauE/SafE
VWVAAARRFFTLLAVVAGAVFLCALSVGLIIGSSLNRAIAVGFEAFGCLLLVLGFFVGNRGPVRQKDEASPFFGPRFLRWATHDEHQSTIAESAIFIILGLLLIVIGLLIDSRYHLV